MATHDRLQSGGAHDGAWKLDRERVVRLTPRESHFLRACSGQLWVTLATPPGTPAGAATDHVLGAGERMLVQAGQTAVISVTGRRGAPASFDWDRVTAPRHAEPRFSPLQWLAQLGLAPQPAR